MIKRFFNITFAVMMVISAQARALESDVRIKLFGTAALLPAHDIQRQLADTPALDMGADARIMFRHNWGSLKLIVDHSTTLISGDSFARQAAPQTSLDQTPFDDDARLMDLTFQIESGSRHRGLHRFDRLALRYQQSNWALTIGRQAVSWGNGMAFSPMDLLSPFAPTVIDQDHKAGDDILLLERLFDNGQDLQFLTVARRNTGGDVSGQVGSAALKWHGFVGEGELELLIAKHYQDKVFAISGRMPLGGALLRSDLVATQLKNGGMKVSGVVNLDYSLSIKETTVYLFAEYYRNGFGVNTLPTSPIALPENLQTRLQRGEVFNLMKDYGAVGIAVPWHLLLNQSLTFLFNLHDASSLLQTSLSYDPGDHQRVQLGVVQPLGRAGQEYGGVPLLGTTTTTGGGTRLFLRWQYYF